MMRGLSAVAAGLAVVSVASAAHAQHGGSFGDRGEFIISADRLFPLLGYSHASITETNPPPGDKETLSESSSSIGLFWGNTPSFVDESALARGVGGIPVTNFYTVPRVGLDYTIIPNLTIGGDIIVFATLGASAQTETDNNAGGKQTASVPAPTTTTFGFAPRAGYILHLSDLFAIWLRGGLSFYTQTWKQTSTNGNTNTSFSANYDQLALDLDPQFVVTPIPHLGFTAGVTTDIPITGGHSYTSVNNGTSSSVSAGANLFFIGGTIGMLVWF
jgi:hypothetical protein